ncbi:hypothetical protein DNL40_08445 [Xylanimonas oleitrophica]|uniref:HTH luxR-type domain-containing protein n=1 Tax=Xylanimonas oleitrophica TaxID=2607479 RepID=A0A2W5WQB5_9MICO|nr:helix-turn-helix domain-containing protein [Xylanimonas oleitrophica]PZR53517.1 hypothetical protein DNL40_08445 [Xylanimonas oleitrophica]
MLEDVLGLSRSAALAYRELVSAPSLDATELGARMGLEPHEAALVLRDLEDSGLVARQTVDAARFAAAPPEIALGAMLARRSDEIRDARVELTRLEELYRSSAATRRPTDVLDVVHGAEAVRQRFEQLQLGAQERVDAFVRPPVLAVGTGETSAEDEAVSRGVHYRVLLDRRLLDSGQITLNAAIEAVAGGEDVRVADALPVKMLIIDRRLAYVPLASHDPEGQDEAVGALVVHGGALLDALVTLFDTTWRHAMPVVAEPRIPGSGDGRIDETDARILALLLSGTTDQAVANQLALSLRTVQRRVRALMDVAGVDTRIQLGWHAARHDWV